MVRQLRRQLRRQEQILTITRALTLEHDLDQLLPLVAHHTCEALNADRATIFLLDQRTQQLCLRVASELEIADIRLPLGVGLAGYAAQTGEILNIADCYADPRFDRTTDHQTGYLTRSMLVMPMRDADGAITGIFEVLNKRSDKGRLLPAPATAWPRFTDDDVALLSSVAASAAIAFENARLIAEVKQMFGSTVQLLVTAMDRRNRETAGHSQRVALSVVILARRLGLPYLEVEKLRYAGLLHDVGKVGITDAVLTKPGTLTDEERQQMNSHALFTRQILQEARFLHGFEDIPLIAGQHHERLDGSGYPLGQKGDEITLGGRLLAVADTYDALRQRRVYKPAFSVEQSMAVLREEVQRQRLDGQIVALLEQCLLEVEAACAPLRPLLHDAAGVA